MRWYFGIVFLIGLLVSIVFRSSNPAAWGITLGMILGSLLIFFFASAVFFLVAFAFGAVKQIVFAEPPQPESPFSSDAMPPQIIPPEAARD